MIRYAMRIPPLRRRHWLLGRLRLQRLESCCSALVEPGVARRAMAVAALAARVRLGALGVRTMQAQGFSSDKSEDLDRGAGSIREAGGAFAKRELAEEERYFRAQAKEQLASLKKHHEEEISYSKKEIERLQKEIERHKQKMKKLKQDD